MGRFIVSLWVMLFAGTGSVVAGTIYRVTLDGAKVRAGAGPQYEIIAQLPQGQVLTPVAARNNWLQIRLPDGGAGWVFSAAVSRGDTAGLPQALTPFVGDYWLLAIGIDRYDYWPSLRNAVNDARSVAEMMVKHYGFQRKHVITLFDAEATEKNIINAFVHLKEQLSDTDSLLIYYAGHGILDQFDEGSWIPVDARENEISQFITTQRVNRMIGKLPARHIFLVADACYSGSLFVSRSGSLRLPRVFNNRFFIENSRRFSRQALSSGGIEEVLDEGVNGHSIFAYHFLRELQLNQAPFLAASHLSARVEKMVARNAVQKPRWDHLRNANDEDGEFFFIRRQPPPDPSGGAVTLQTDPPDATIIVEGENFGRGPVTLSNLSGRIAVAATKSGYHKVARRITIDPERPQRVTLALTPDQPATLVISSEPPGAQWYLDGHLMGTTPDEVTVTGAVTHRLRVVHPRFQTWEQFRQIPPSGTARIVARLKPVPGSIQPPASLNPTADELEAVLDQIVVALAGKDLPRIDRLISLSKDDKALLDRQLAGPGPVEVTIEGYRLNNLRATATLKLTTAAARSNRGDQQMLIVNLVRQGGRWLSERWQRQ